jgi:hypothetical protein
MHTLRVGAESHDGVMLHQTDDRGGDRAPNDVAPSCSRDELRHGDLWRLGRARSESADVLRCWIRRPGARPANPADEVLQKIGRHRIADLDLELAEPRGEPAPLEDRHLVVHDVAEHLARVVSKLGPPAKRVGFVIRSRCKSMESKRRDSVCEPYAMTSPKQEAHQIVAHASRSRL